MTTNAESPASAAEGDAQTTAAIIDAGLIAILRAGAVPRSSARAR